MARSLYRDTVTVRGPAGLVPLAGARVQFYVLNGPAPPYTPIAFPLYPDGVSTTPLPVPFVTGPLGEVEVWADEPHRVRMIVDAPGLDVANEVIDIETDPSSVSTDADVGAAIADHEAKADPHDQYLTQPEGDLLYKPLPWEPDLGGYYTKDEADAAFLDQGEADLRYEQLSRKGAPSGYAPLDLGGVIPNQYLPALAITETFVVPSEAEMLALPAQQGDVAVRLDTTENYILAADPATVLANWTKLAASTTAGNTSVLRREEFTPAAAATTVTLAAPPTTLHAVSRNGVGQSEPAGHFSVSGLVLTFSDPFVAGERVAVVYEIGSTVPAPINGYTKEESDARYLQESQADTRYVNVAGDTMTGALRVHYDGLDYQATLDPVGLHLQDNPANPYTATYGITGWWLAPDGGAGGPDVYLTRTGVRTAELSFTQLPDMTGMRDIGSTSRRWGKLWAKDADLETSLLVASKPVGVSPDSGNALVWRANGFYSSGSGGNVTVVNREEFFPAAAATTVTLAQAPTELLSVSRNGVDQFAGSGDYSLAGAVITFTDAFVAGEKVSVLSEVGTSVPVDAYTTAQSEARYVNVTGDVMTGVLQVNANVGVGVVPEAYPVGYRAIRVGAGSAFWGDASGAAGTYISANTWHDGTNFKAIINAPATHINIGSGGFHVNTAPIVAAGANQTMTPRFSVDIAGNVGVGVSPSVWGAAHRALQVGGISAVWGDTAAAGTGSAFVSANVYYDGAAYRALGAGPGTMLQQGNGALMLATAPAVAAGAAQTFTTRLQVSQTGITSITTDDQEPLVLNRNQAANYLPYIAFNRQGASKWHLGLWPTADDFILYSGDMSKARITVAPTGTVTLTPDAGQAALIAGTLQVAAVTGSNPRLTAASGASLELVGTSTYVTPGVDNNQHLGHPSVRWADVYAVAGTINTSSLKYKDPEGDLDPEAALAAVLRTPARRFRYKGTERLQSGYYLEEADPLFTIGPDEASPSNDAGVLLGAIQALHAQVEYLRSRLEDA